jgi:hypothetical protein
MLYKYCCSIKTNHLIFIHLEARIRGFAEFSSKNKPPEVSAEPRLLELCQTQNTIVINVTPVSIGRSGPRRIVSPVSAESKLARAMPNAGDNRDNCHTIEHQRCVPRRNPRWSERSEWNLGYESHRTTAHRRCRLLHTFHSQTCFFAITCLIFAINIKIFQL